MGSPAPLAVPTRLAGSSGSVGDVRSGAVGAAEQSPLVATTSWRPAAPRGGSAQPAAPPPPTSAAYRDLQAVAAEEFRLLEAAKERIRAELELLKRDELRIQGVIRRLTSSTSTSTTPGLPSHMATPSPPRIPGAAPWRPRLAGESGRASLLTPSPTDLLLDGEEDDVDADGFPLTQPALDAAPSWNTARLDLSMHRRPADSLSGFASQPSQPSQPSQDDVPLDHYDFDNGDDDGDGGVAASLDSSQYSHLAALLQSAGIGTQALAGWPSLSLSPTPTQAAGRSSSAGGRRYYATASTGADDDEDNDGTSDDNDDEGDLEGVEGLHGGSATTTGAAATALVSYAFPGHGHDRMDEDDDDDDDDDLGDGLDANSTALDMGPGALERLRARVAANAAAVLQQYGEEEEEEDDDDAHDLED